MWFCCTGNAEAQAGESGAGPSSSNTNQAAPSAAAAAAEEEEDNIDPEFLAALPPEIQAEVLEQQRRERRMRQRQRQQQEAAAAAAAQVSRAADMEHEYCQPATCAGSVTACCLAGAVFMRT